MKPYAAIADATRPGLSVDECARRLQRYVAIERQLMRLGAGHLQGTPEWELKTAQARHQWEDAEHADWLTKRLPQLRCNLSGVARLASGRLGRFLEEALRSRGSVEYVTAVYGVIKPHLLCAYRRYLAETSPLADNPTCRQLGFIVEEEEAHLAWGQEALAELTSSDADRATSRAWREHLEAYLAAAGGIDGDRAWVEAALPEPRSAEPFRVARESARDSRFHPRVPKDWQPRTGDPTRDKLIEMMWRRLQEMTAVEMVGTVMIEWEGLPWEALHDLARHLWDEMRHSLFGQSALELEGTPFTEVPSWIGYAHHQMALSPRDRYGHLVFGEMNAMQRPEPSKRAQYEFCRATARHPMMTLYQDFDWADEVLHAQYGRRWFVDYAFNGDRDAANAVGRMTNEQRRQFYDEWKRDHPEDAPMVVARGDHP